MYLYLAPLEQIYRAIQTVPVRELAPKIQEERNIKIVPPGQDLTALARFIGFGNVMQAPPKH